MKLRQHTKNTQPTVMRDIYEHLTGEMVCIWTSGPNEFEGTLMEYNGCIVHLVCEGNYKHNYIPIEKIVSISSAK